MTTFEHQQHQQQHECRSGVAAGRLRVDRDLAVVELLSAAEPSARPR